MSYRKNSKGNPVKEVPNMYLPVCSHVGSLRNPMRDACFSGQLGDYWAGHGFARPSSLAALSGQ